MLNDIPLINSFGLWLEIAAESARNPCVASLLMQSRKVIVEQFTEQLRLRCNVDNEKELIRLKAGMEIMSAIFMGLSVNTPQHSAETRIEKTN